MTPEDIPNDFSIDDKINIVTKGSNVFAVSPDITKNGETFLAINSHQPWNGDLAWYEAHIYSDEGLNISDVTMFFLYTPPGLYVFVKLLGLNSGSAPKNSYVFLIVCLGSWLSSSWVIIKTLEKTSIALLIFL